LSLFVLGAIGLVCMRRYPRLGRWLTGIAGALLLLLSLPFVAAALLKSLEGTPVIATALLDPKAQAIVVLGADARPFAPDYDGSTVGELSLERIRYAAHLARATKLPILTSGGTMPHVVRPLAELMADALEKDFQLPVRWREVMSHDTRQNARRSAEILLADGIHRVYLVTHAWHMPRARKEFESAGLEVVAAPTGMRNWPPFDFGAFLPSARALRESSFAVHEWIGAAWYGWQDS
jgi:uncharacterized SAM-binding protein YcdF (DUF218 family)